MTEQPLVWAIAFAVGAALATGAFYASRWLVGRWMA